MRGMGDEASSRYKAALDILSHVVPAEEGGKPGNEWYFERRGDILAALRDPDGALDSYRRALACPEASEAKKRAALLRTIAQLYVGKEACQSAEEALREAAGAATSAGDGETEALVQLGLADLYCNRLSRFRDAVACAAEKKSTSAIWAWVCWQSETWRLPVRRFLDGITCESLTCWPDYQRRIASRARDWPNSSSLFLAIRISKMQFGGSINR